MTTHREAPASTASVPAAPAGATGPARRGRTGVRLTTVATLVVAVAVVAFRAGSSRAVHVTPVAAATTTVPAPASATVPAPVAVGTRVVRLTAGSGTGGHPGPFTVSAYDDQMLVSAPIGQPNGNQRVAVVRDDAVTSRNQTQCVSWDHESTFVNQEGVVLRLRPLGGGAYSAISVTKNVWGQVVWTFNVHEWNGVGAEPGSSKFHTLVQFPMPSVVAPAMTEGGDQTAPWSLCARAVDAVVQVKVWVGDGPEPSWNDPVHVRTALLPATVRRPGKPGVYVGHLGAADVMHYLRVWNEPTPAHIGSGWSGVGGASPGGESGRKGSGEGGSGGGVHRGSTT